MNRHPRLAAASLVGFLVLAFNGVTPALEVAFGRVVRAIGGGGNVNLPYQVMDSTGNQWMVYQGGWIQMQGNNPVYSQGAMLQLNGNQPNVRNNTARLDDKTGEVIFDNMQAGNFTVTRRVLIDKEGGYARYIDVIRNNQAQEQTVAVQIQSNMNYGIDSGTPINDPRRKANTIAWAGMTGNGRCVLEMYSGKGAKVTPGTINFQQGNSHVQGQYQLTIPANKEVALMHLHAIVGSTEQATKFVQDFRESKVMASLPADLRKLIINFSAGAGFIGERELLRGDLFDVVEIRGGDQMRGNLKEPSYKLETFYGNVELSASRVIALINVGEFRPRQLLVTTDGEIFGGKLGKETITLELTTGQSTQIPLSQITRIGYRKRAEEPEECTFDKPFVALRSGERIGIEMPAEPIEIVTRYGPLKLGPKSISAILFQTEEHGVHDVYLTDGSKFAGLVAAPEFAMKLSAGTPSAGSTQPADAPPVGVQTVRFPSSAIARIQFVPPGEGVDEAETATLALANEDLLVGQLTGALKLDTAFDTLSINARELRKLTRGKEGAMDVQVTLWDASVVSGQLQDPSLQCQLASGVTVSIPVALVEEYNQPTPAPAAGMVEKIKAAVAQLNADDWKVRDRAEAELTSMGAVVVSVLKEMRATQPPEAQQRIDQILANVAKKR